MDFLCTPAHTYVGGRSLLRSLALLGGFLCTAIEPWLKLDDNTALGCTLRSKYTGARICIGIPARGDPGTSAVRMRTGSLRCAQVRARTPDGVGVAALIRKLVELTPHEASRQPSRSAS